MSKTIPAIKRILVTSNLSECSAYTLRYALGLAKATGAELHALHVCESLSEDAKVTLMMFMQDETARKRAFGQRIERAQKALADSIDALFSGADGEMQDLRGKIAAADVIEGFPAEVILSEAKARACDMIVLGAHEHGMNHTFIGTVAKRVMRRADIPTVIVPYRQET